MKKRFGRRFLSMLLSVVMVFSLLPMSVFAADSGDTESETQTGFTAVTLDSQTVNVGFGETLDPNTVTTVTGDIKLAAGVSMDGKVATGFMEMYLPLNLVVEIIMDELNKATEGLGNLQVLTYDEYRYTQSYPTDDEIKTNINMFLTNLPVFAGMFGIVLTEEQKEAISAGQAKLESIESLYTATSIEEIIAVMGFTAESGYATMDADGNMITALDGISPEMGDKMLLLYGMVTDMATTINSKLENGAATTTTVRVCGNEEKTTDGQAVADDYSNVLWYDNEDGAVDASGKVIPYVAYEGLTERDEVGFYIVGGMEYGSETAVPTFAIYVNAPELVEVTIAVDEKDRGYFVRKTYNSKAVDVTATYDTTADEEGTGTLITKYIGVETDGGLLAASDTAPTESGVYTVFSFYFNENTLAMGADAAALIIEPAPVANGTFALAETEKVYDGEQHFADLTSSKYDAVKIAVDTDTTDGKHVYVTLPDNFSDKIAALEADVDTIIDAYLDSRLQNALPLHTGLTETVLGSLAALEKKLGGTYEVTKGDVVEWMQDYITAVRARYSVDGVLDKVGDYAEAVKTTLTTNETVLEYKAIFSAALDKYDEYSALLASGGTATASVMTLAAEEDDSRGEALVTAFLTQFMTRAGVYKDDVKALAKDVIDYAVDYAQGSAYKQDALTVIEALGALGGVDVTDALANVKAAFNTMDEKVTAYINAEEFEPNKASAAVVLGYVADCINDVLDEAYAVAQAYGDDLVIHYGTTPSDVGVYNCYAVNVSANYMPTLVNNTLEIIQPVTITVLDQTIGFGGSIDGTKYTVTDTVTGKAITVDGLTVTLSLVEEVDTNTANTYENVIRATYEITGDTKYDVTIVDENAGDDDNYANLTVSNCAHPADKVTSEVTAPTCTEDGYTTYTCECGHSWTANEVNATGHTEVVDEAVAPDCINTGLTEGKHCSVCGTVTVAQTVVDALGHTEVVDAAVAATCEATGLTEGKHCSVCGVVTVAQTVVGALGHDYEGVVTTAATCTTAGLMTYTCKNDANHTYTEEIPATGIHTDEDKNNKCDSCDKNLCTEHTEETIPGYAATCTEPGLTDGLKCSICGYVITAQEEIPATGHTWNDGVVTEPTCENKGYTTYTCTISDCGETKIENTKSALGHAWNDGEVTKDATCYAKGKKTFTCERGCTKTEAIATTAHTPGAAVTEHKDATCTETGYDKTIVKCSVVECGKVISEETVVIPELGHDFDSETGECKNGCGKTKCIEHEPGAPTKENVVEANCLVDYSYESVVKCTACGEELSRERITHVGTKTGHVGGEYVKASDGHTEPTCIAEGKYWYVQYCTVCEQEVDRYSVSVPVTIHKDVEKNVSDVVDAVDGIGDGYCDVCEVLMCTHTDNWVVMPGELPTCTESGLSDGLKCTVVGCEQIVKAREVLPKLGHTAGDPVPGEMVAPTCTNYGYTWMHVYCEICAAPLQSWKTNFISATGHTDTDGDNTCDSCGKTCLNGHTYGEAVTTTVAPTCTSRGYDRIVETCTVDGCGHTRTEKNNYVAALGHVDGDDDHKCDRCDHNMCKHTLVETGHRDATCVLSGYTSYKCTCDCGCTYTTTGDRVSKLGHDITGAGILATASYHYQICQRTECQQQINTAAHTFALSGTGEEWYCTVCGYHMKAEERDFDAAEHISATLRDNGITSEEKVKETMEAALNVADGTYAKRKLLYVVLKDSNGNIVESTFGDEKLTVSIAIPDGVDPDQEIVLTHLIDSGEKAGQVEIFKTSDGTLTVDKTNSKLTFQVTSLSPFEVFGSETEEETDETTQYKFGQTTQIRLIEPWGLKANARVYIDDSARYIDYNTLYDYGVYFIRKSDLDTEGLTQATITQADILNDSDYVKYSKGDDEHVYVDTLNNENKDEVLTAIYDKGLYTYEFSEDSIFVMFYVQDKENGEIQYAAIRERNMSEQVKKQRDNTDLPDDEREVYKWMAQLEVDVLTYREGKDPGDGVRSNAPTLATSGLGAPAVNNEYSFGHKNQIRLIEPWGLKVNARVYTNSMQPTIDYSTLEDYGVVIWYDVGGTYAGTEMTVEELLSKTEANVYSGSNGYATIGAYPGTDYSGIVACFEEGIYTYQLDTNAYVMFFIKDAGNYYYGPVKTRNVKNLMKNHSTTDEEELAVYTDMLGLYDAITAYRARVLK